MLSGYVQAQENGEITEHDLLTETGRKRVPILEPAHMGTDMAIDEKYIDQQYYTVLSNAETGKIAMMAETTDKKELVGLISKFGDARLKVKAVSRDLSPTYDWVCRESFWNAAQIADKFHVIKRVMEQLQQIRITLRQKELARIREQQSKHYKAEFARLATAKKLGTKYKVKKFEPGHIVMSNGETLMELLARSRYLLFKMPGKWTENQKARAKALFEYYPALESVYDLVIEFRQWYSRNNIGIEREIMIARLNKWYQNAKCYMIDEIFNIASMIQRHEGVILNYFQSGRTNAIAEAVNGKIQRFISSSYGIRDIDFFLFRMKIFFASTSK